MKVDKMYACMCVILLNSAKEHIGLNVVGMAGQYWMAKEINDKLKEREEIRQSDIILTEAYKSLNEEVSRLTTEVKRGILQREVLEMKGTSEMWRVLKSLTEFKPNNHLHYH